MQEEKWQPVPTTKSDMNSDVAGDFDIHDENESEATDDESDISEWEGEATLQSNETGPVEEVDPRTSQQEAESFDIAHFYRTTKTVNGHPGEKVVVDIPTEILMDIFDQLFSTGPESVAYLRFVCRQFRRLADPLVFKKIRLTHLQLRHRDPRNPLDWAQGHLPRQSVIEYAKAYATVVSIEHLEVFIPQYVINLIPQLGRLQKFILKFRSHSVMMCDPRVFQALEEAASDFVVQIEWGGSQVVLTFEGGKVKPARLRTVAVDVVGSICLTSFSIYDFEWSSTETLILNGAFQMGAARKLPNVKTLKLDCTAKESVLNSFSYKTANHLLDLNVWFPNLAHFELDFQDFSGIMQPGDTVTWMDRMTAFRKLCHLSFKLIPPFIEGIFIKGKLCSPHEGKQRSNWHEGCEDMTDGPNRIEVYKARSKRVASNILDALRVRKQGKPFTEMHFIIKAWDHVGRRDWDRHARRVFTWEPSKFSESWSLKCVPRITYKWTKEIREPGEPMMIEEIDEIQCSMGCKPD